jgi:hypothetical protein
MAARQTGQLELPIFICPTDPGFSGGTLDNAQSSAWNERSLRGANDAGETQFGGRSCVWDLLSGQRDSRNSNQPEQYGEPFTQHISRPFVSRINTVLPLPKFHNFAAKLSNDSTHYLRLVVLDVIIP